jgi:hypothetical protein|tara:strand:- start:194 stop:526 length:333 start_codon:yes stop_codon:yes gene_type:complete
MIKLGNMIKELGLPSFDPPNKFLRGEISKQSLISKAAPLVQEFAFVDDSMLQALKFTATERDANKVWKALKQGGLAAYFDPPTESDQPEMWYIDTRTATADGLILDKIGS